LFSNHNGTFLFSTQSSFCEILEKNASGQLFLQLENPINTKPMGKSGIMAVQKIALDPSKKKSTGTIDIKIIRKMISEILEIVLFIFV